jgi:hypothetical protein
MFSLAVLKQIEAKIDSVPLISVTSEVKDIQFLVKNIIITNYRFMYNKFSITFIKEISGW